MFDDIKHHIKISIDADNEDSRLGGIAYIGNLISATEIQTRMKNSLADDTNTELRRRYDTRDRDEMMHAPHPIPSPSDMLVEFVEPAPTKPKVEPAKATVNVPLSPEEMLEAVTIRDVPQLENRRRLLHNYPANSDYQDSKSLVMRHLNHISKYDLQNAYGVRYMTVNLIEGVDGHVGRLSGNGDFTIRVEDLLAIAVDYLSNHDEAVNLPIKNRIVGALQMMHGKVN